MTNRELVRIGSAVAARLPGFELHGSILALRPVTHTLRALLIESHGDERTRFSIWAFVLPLCVPTEHIILNFGEKLKGPSGGMWDGGDPSALERLIAAVETQAMPFLAPLDAPRDVARAILHRSALANPQTWQAAAYLFAKEHNGTAALDALTHLMELLDPVRVAGHAPILERARWLAERVVAKPDEVDAKLVEWEHQTIHNLGLGPLVTASNA